MSIPFHTLDECAFLVRDSVHPRDAKGMPYIGLEHIEEGALHLKGHGWAEDVTSAKSRFKEGDILFGKLRPYFRKAIIAPFDGVCSTDIWVVRAKPGMIQGYIFYWMASEDFVNFANSGSIGTRMPRAKWDHASRHKQRKLSPNGQRAIARTLGALDDKIETNRKMNTTLESIAQTLFQSWFIDFAPVHAKSKGRPPGLPPQIAKLFPDGFEDSELGKIPNGWRIVSLSDVAKIIKGRSYKSAELSESSTALVTLKSFQRGGGYRADGLKPYIGEFKPEQEIKTGELIIAYTDVTQAGEVIGRPAIVMPTDEFSTLVASLDVGIVRPISRDLSIPYLYCMFLTDGFQNHVRGYSTGTTVLHLNAKGLPSYKFACPPAELMRHYNQASEALLDRISVNHEESHSLGKIRDNLLSRLLSGKLRIKA